MLYHLNKNSFLFIHNRVGCFSSLLSEHGKRIPYFHWVLCSTLKPLNFVAVPLRMAIILTVWVNWKKVKKKRTFNDIDMYIAIYSTVLSCCFLPLDWTTVSYVLWNTFTVCCWSMKICKGSKIQLWWKDSANVNSQINGPCLFRHWSTIVNGKWCISSTRIRSWMQSRVKLARRLCTDCCGKHISAYREIKSNGGVISEITILPLRQKFYLVFDNGQLDRQYTWLAHLIIIKHNMYFTIKEHFSAWGTN